MRYIFTCICFIGFLCFKAQEQETDLDKLLNEKENKKPETELVIATFHSSRIVNGHTVETPAAGVFDMKIFHRFGTLNSGLYNLFGLDNAWIRIGGDYGITDKLSIGMGRSGFQKQYDGFIKYAIFQQKTGKNHFPISMSYVGSAMIKTQKNTDTFKRTFADRLHYAHQLLIARKFSNNFSLQLMPSVVHYNTVPMANDPNDIIALGVGTRLRLTQRVSLNTEYYYQFTRLQDTKNSLSIGFDIETGGHVFQLHFTNSTGMTERTFISETKGSWGKGDIHFGFNVSRVFNLSKKAKGK